MTFGRQNPYNALPDLPPAAEVETGRVLREAIKAGRLLGELKGYCMTLPKPELLLTSVVLQESKDSSAIENIVTTQDELYQGLATPEHATPEVKEVLRYREAVYTGQAELKRTGAITTNLMVRVMQRLKHTTGGIRNLPGTVLKNAQQEVIYTPPSGEDVIRQKLGALEQFINQDPLPYDPLVMMALMHYQFEAIHPFADGNGRTGRILNVLYLVQQGLLVLPVLYLSGYIIQNKTDYYRLLRLVTEEKAWEEWVLYILQGVSETAGFTLARIKELNELRDQTFDQARQVLPNGPARELTDLMFSFPYLKISTLEQQGVAKRQTASRYLYAMAEAGMLRPMKVGRDMYFINDRLISHLSS